MIKIPENVEEWDIGLIAKIIHEGYDENEILEFKSSINADTKKIPITACAFANTRGGTIILGVNNDRTNPLSFDQRLVGLDDSDDLKSKITNQLKNIKPDVLLSNIIFKESNIKLFNGKVIVIVKIIKSKKAPHQFEHKFYKRISNGNTEMDVEEIREMILESQKNKRLLRLFRQEGGVLRDDLINIKKKVEENILWEAIFGTKNLKVVSIRHFLYEQSFLYSLEIQDRILRIIEVAEKLMDYTDHLELVMSQETKDFTGEFLGKNYKNNHEYVKDILLTYVKQGLTHFEKLELLLNEKFILPVSTEVLLEENYQPLIQHANENE